MNQSIIVVTLFDKYLDLMADYELDMSAMNEEIQCLQMRVGDMEKDAAELVKQSPVAQKASKPSGQHGGWMPRCAQLIVAIRKEKWHTVQTLAAKYYEFNNMKEMVDRMR